MITEERSVQLNRVAITALLAVVLVGAAGLAMVGTVSAEDVSQCRAIESSGTYVLTQDIQDDVDDACIDINADDVTFDGNGHTIDGQGESGIGIRNQGQSNVTVTDVTVANYPENTAISYDGGASGEIRNSNFNNSEAGVIVLNTNTGVTLVNNTAADNIGDGFFVSNSTNNVLENNHAIDNAGNGFILFPGSSDNVLRSNTAAGNNQSGIRIRNGTGNTLTDNVVVQNLRSGIRLRGTAEGNQIYDNLLNNNVNVEFSDNFENGSNQWNIVREPETNVIGGPNTAGNYYAEPGDPEGYSEQCTDINGNAICDESYDLNGGGSANTDEMPITVPGRPDITISQQSIDFGEIVSGERTSEEVVIENQGNATLSVDSVEINGQNASAFDLEGVSSGGSFTLGPGDSETFRVAFSSGPTCDKAATLRVTSDDPDEGTKPVPLSGSVRPQIVNGFNSPPTNTDEDCLYENVNGDGEFSISDVQALFANLDRIDDRADRDAFDFNGDGEVTVSDVQALFAELTED